MKRSSCLASGLACFVGLFAALGCGPAPKPAAAEPRTGAAAAPASAPEAAPPSATPANAGAPAGTSASSSPAASSAPEPNARAFAKSNVEATSIIDDVIEKRRPAIEDCVAAARTRRKEPHAKVEFDVGIDQEGALIGVKAPKGQKDDPVLHECVRGALKNAPFPRSNAGVITMRKTYAYLVVYPK